MGRVRDRIDAGVAAQRTLPGQREDLSEAQDLYDTAIGDLKNFEVGDFYSNLEVDTIDPSKLSMRDGENFGQLGGQRAIAGQGVQRLGTAEGYTGEGYTGEGYTAQGTNVGQLQRGANTGLSNVFNNLQVSTAGSEMAAQEADQSLAASQDLAAQAGTGAGGATALAAAAAKSKQGISADIDRQVKANEQLRAQGEQSLQRDMLAQGNLASQFDLGQSQFNVGAQNAASQFSASARNQANQFSAGARNQANQFSAGQRNQFRQAQFSADVDLSKFNAGQANAERMAEFGALQNANAANAGAINNAMAQNSSMTNDFNMGQAAGLTSQDQAKYGQLMDIASIETENLNNIQETVDANEQILAAGSAAQDTQNKKGNFWRKLFGVATLGVSEGTGLGKAIYDPNNPSNNRING